MEQVVEALLDGEPFVAFVEQLGAESGDLGAVLAQGPVLVGLPVEDAVEAGQDPVDVVAQVGGVGVL